MFNVNEETYKERNVHLTWCIIDVLLFLQLIRSTINSRLLYESIPSFSQLQSISSGKVCLPFNTVTTYLQPNKPTFRCMVWYKLGQFVQLQIQMSQRLFISLGELNHIYTRLPRKNACNCNKSDHIEKYCSRLICKVAIKKDVQIVTIVRYPLVVTTVNCYSCLVIKLRNVKWQRFTKNATNLGIWNVNAKPKFYTLIHCIFLFVESFLCSLLFS